MLVLSRRKHEKLILTVPGDRTASGEPLVIKVALSAVSRKQRSARIGIEAPRYVNVVRPEVEVRT